jgi:membrane fusion protein (multidrug efflux system)
MKVSIITKLLYVQALLITVLVSCKQETPPEANPLEIAVIEVLQQDVRLESEFTPVKLLVNRTSRSIPRVDGVIESLNFQRREVLVTKGRVAVHHRSAAIIKLK